MKNYLIDKQNNPNWRIFSEQNTGFCIEYADSIANILYHVKLEFERAFGKDYVRNYKYLSVLHTVNDPETSRGNNLIFLCVSNYPPQVIYQFSHELCHFMIPEDVYAGLRWFEESLCRMASLYFLKAVYQSNISNDRYATIPNYLKNELAKGAIMSGKTTSEFLNEHIKSLRADPYLRDYNAVFACSLLPIFEANPDAWKIIPQLCNLTDDMPFKQSLEQLYNLCDECYHAIIGQIISTLCD